jgi:hypothetical protein
MKTILRISAIAIVLGSMVMADVPFLPIKLVPEAQAIFGVRRRTAVVAYSAGAATASAAAASQQQAAAAIPPPPAAAGQPLPVGTVVSALPQGCVSTPVGGVEYYYCGGNFYRAVFQGNQLVYVTAQPK